MENKTLSIIIPVFNEKNTIEEIIAKVKAVTIKNITKEIIVIDDKSTDGTTDILKNIKDIVYICKKDNEGKGSAIKMGFDNASGDILVIQDADLEYDPEEYPRLISPILNNRADVVFGSRFMSGKDHVVLRFHHYTANRFLTILSNICSGIALTDMETGYKVFSKDVYKALAKKLISKRFGIEPEITARIAKMNIRIYEIGISYHSRGYIDGKKINWKDGFAAIWHIINYNFFAK